MKNCADQPPAPVGIPDGSDQRAVIAAALARMAEGLSALASALATPPASPNPTLRDPRADPDAERRRLAPILTRGSQEILDSPPLREVINDFIVAKARSNRSERYIRQLRYSLANFARGRSHTPIDLITVTEMEHWTAGQSQRKRSKTVHGYLGDIRTLFNFAMRRGYCLKNPATAIDTPLNDARFQPVTIHTPQQVADVLEGVRALRFAKTRSLDLVRHLAIRFFSGLRSSEAHQLTEANLLPGDRRSPFGYIEVTARVSKTRQRRLVSILPNLAAWLALGGVLRPLSRDKVRKAIAATGVPWNHNATRHSFCSHHLVKFENAAKTALEAGHSEEKLFAHYRAVVTMDQADDYFAIYPDHLVAREPTQTLPPDYWRNDA